MSNYGCQSMYKKIKKILIKKVEDAYISQEILNRDAKKYNYIGIPNYKECLVEYKKFEDIIKEYIEEVHYLPADDITGLDSIYAHDSVKVTSLGTIGFPMGKELRSNEYLATTKYLKSIGIPTIGIIEKPAKIEGGDIVWIDEKTVAIGQGYRTNLEGINQFKKLTKDIVEEYIIVPSVHADGENECLHLMSIISIVDKDLAVVYSKYMPVFFRQYLIEKGFKLIEVPDIEYYNLGCNVLALAPRVCMMVEGNPITAQALRDAGAIVHEYKAQEIGFRGTGGPTCLTCPIQREV